MAANGAYLKAMVTMAWITRRSWGLHVLGRSMVVFTRCRDPPAAQNQTGSRGCYARDSGKKEDIQTGSGPLRLLATGDKGDWASQY